ncbi:MAG: hypothetical protein K5779_06485 [Saccharofermentans sp.]|nr:hypothetical protein [Saccharofermentans sp.]
MLRRSAKFTALITALMLIITASGCDTGTAYSLESTRFSSAVSETAATKPSVYIRSSFDINKNPYYAMLSETEMNAYSFVYEELIKGNQKFECPFTISADQLSKATDAMLNDHPELFWLDNSYGYTYDPADGTVKEITFNFFDFADTPEKLRDARSRFDSAAEKIITEASKYPTQAERELYIHDYICDNTGYDENAPYNQSAYSVIVLHSSVCAGYARSFQYLMQKSGFTCYYVTGRTEKSSQVLGGNDENGTHSWDIVFIAGEYYNVDCLWDDTASDSYGSPIYPFFNIPDEELVNHVRINMATRLPGCHSTDYRYSNLFGPTVEASSIVFTDAG